MPIIKTNACLWKWIPFFLIALTACSRKEEKILRYIPKDAAQVWVCNNKSLIYTLSGHRKFLDSIFLSQPFFINKDGTYRTLQTFLNATGLDWKNNAYFFETIEGNLHDGKIENKFFLAGIQDTTRFQQFVRQHFFSITTTKDFAYTIYSNSPKEKIIISWNQAICLFQRFKAQRPFYHSQLDSSLIALPSDLALAINKLSKIYTQSLEESILDIKNFKEVFHKNATVVHYASDKSLLSILNRLPFNLIGIEKLVENNYSITYFNFKKGAVEATLDFYPNDTIAALLKKFPAPPLSKENLLKIPEGKYLWAFLNNYSPDFFQQIIQRADVLPMFNLMLNKNYQYDSLYALFNGSFNAFLFTQPPAADTAYEFFISNKVKQPLVLDSFWVNLLKQKWYKKRSIDSTQQKIFSLINKDQLYFSSLPLDLDNHSSKSLAHPELSAFLRKYPQATSLCWIDFTPFLAKYPAHFIHNFNNLKISVGPYNGKTLSAKISISMENKKENSMVQLIGWYLDKHSTTKEK